MTKYSKENMAFWEKEYQAGRSLHRWPDESLISFAIKTLRSDGRARRILDVACGSGRHVMMLAQLGFDVTGVEPSATAREFANRWIELEDRSETARVLDGDARALDFADGTFDVVVAWNFWNNLESGAELHTALGEMRRVLRPGGRLVCTLTSPDDCNYANSRPVDGENVREIVSGGYTGLKMRFWTEEQARAFLAEGGFEPERIGPYSRCVDFDPEQKIGGWLVSAVKQ